MRCSAPLVLVVDDDPDSREVFADVLAVSGFRTAQASNGEMAVECAREAAPDLIVLDQSMPIMDGVEAARRLKLDPRTRAIPILMLTGYFASSRDDEVGPWDRRLEKTCTAKQLLLEIRALLSVLVEADQLASCTALLRNPPSALRGRMRSCEIAVGAGCALRGVPASGGVK